MEDFLVLYLIVLVIFLVIQYIVAKKFEKIAFQKGYDESVHSCAMCFWLGVVGYIYVMALPNLNNSLIKSNNEINSAKDVEKVQQYECPKCKEIVPFGIEKCPVCGQVFDWNK